MKIMYFELKLLFRMYKDEFSKFKSFNFLNYLKNLFFPPKKKKSVIFFRILFLVFVFRVFFDIYLVIFNFYYITMEWFLKNLKFLIRIYIVNDFWIIFFDKLFDFLRYVFLFIPIINLRKKLARKKIKFRTYITGIIVDRFFKIILWRPNYWLLLLPFYFISLFFFVAFTLCVFFLVDFILIPMVNFIEFLWLLSLNFVLFFRILYHVWQYNKIAGVLYLRQGSSLFHIATMMQRHGFEAPKSSEIEKLKAKAEYRIYRRRYLKSDMAPDYLDDKALDIYIFLLELFKDTRYELRHIPIKEFFFIIFPFAIVRHIAIFLYYLYIAFGYFLFFIFFPMVYVFVGLGITYQFLKVLELIFFLFFRDLHHLESRKAKIWDKIRRDSIREEKKLLRKAAFRSKLDKFYAIFKSFFK